MPLRSWRDAGRATLLAVPVARTQLKNSAGNRPRPSFVGVGGILDIAANQPEDDYSATFRLAANDL